MSGPGRIGTAARGVRSWMRSRQRPGFSFDPTASGTPTIYFLAPDFDKPSGGVRLMYRHVDQLNAAGLPAKALHQRPGFRCTWFDNDTAVTDARTTPVTAADLLVVPELDVDVVARSQTPVAHVVLNQSGHLTWQREPELLAEHYATSSSLRGMVAVSEHSAELLRYAFPDVPVHRVRPSLDASVFHLGEAAEVSRPRRISYLPRRGNDDIETVLHLLRARGVLEGWDLQPLDGLGQRAFADGLRSSQIMLTGSIQEGFGLPPLEAMACGNYVIGYDGFGGREFFREEFCAPVPTADVLAMAAAVEQAVTRPGSWLTERGARASAFALDEYDVARESEDVVTAYRQLVQGGERP